MDGGRGENGVQKLPENDVAGIAWVGSGWSITSLERNYRFKRFDRFGETRG